MEGQSQQTEEGFGQYKSFGCSCPAVHCASSTSNTVIESFQIFGLVCAAVLGTISLTDVNKILKTRTRLQDASEIFV